MKTVVYGQDERVCRWMSGILGEDVETMASLGLEHDGELIAGVCFNMFTGASISMHVAAVPDKRWMNREFLYRSFAYPFLQLGCRRITGLVRASNVVAQKFDEHIGFKREGLIREAFTDGEDAILYGMLRSECKWIRSNHGW